MLLYENGTPVKAIIEKPVLLDGLEFYINGYEELKSDRQIGMTVGQIPWSSVIKWCEVHNIHDINEKESVVRYFRAMENAEFEYDQKKGIK